MAVAVPMRHFVYLSAYPFPRSELIAQAIQFFSPINPDSALVQTNNCYRQTYPKESLLIVVSSVIQINFKNDLWSSGPNGTPYRTQLAPATRKTDTLRNGSCVEHTWC